MTKVIAMSLKKIFTAVLIIVVSVLVILAFYSNRHKFTGLETIKYEMIEITNPVSASELADKYSDSRTKDRFVSELRKVNGLSSAGTIENDMILIPVFESN